MTWHIATTVEDAPHTRRTRRGPLVADSTSCGSFVCPGLVEANAWISFLMASLAQDKAINTIEELPADEDVVACFDRNHALQCGFCISGMVLPARDMVDKDAAGTREGIREGLGGKPCRSGCSMKIIEALEEAAT